MLDSSPLLEHIFMCVDMYRTAWCLLLTLFSEVKALLQFRVSVQCWDNKIGWPEWNWKNYLPACLHVWDTIDAGVKEQRDVGR